MKHIKALSKVNPKTAFSLPSFDKSGKPCDTILKTPEEKDEKKNNNQTA
ncbi:MAG: hypothetical protein HUU46_13275 [Candidatus Hydrogenedentes bacterium]|nr:hypothetical protein [Candidatus Hydrogenedentota bacterium]